MKITIFSLQILIFAKSAQTAVLLFYFTAAVWLKKPQRRRLTAAVHASAVSDRIKWPVPDRVVVVNLNKIYITILLEIYIAPLCGL